MKEKHGLEVQADRLQELAREIASLTAAYVRLETAARNGIVPELVNGEAGLVLEIIVGSGFERLVLDPQALGDGVCDAMRDLVRSRAALYADDLVASWRNLHSFVDGVVQRFPGNGEPVKVSETIVPCDVAEDDGQDLKDEGDDDGDDEDGDAVSVV